MPLHEVKDWEKEDPNKVNEVPEKTTDFYSASEPFWLLLKHLASKEEVIAAH